VNRPWRRLGYLLPVVLLVAGALKVAVLDILPPSAEVRLQNGLDAIASENYAEAYWWWRPLADRGMAEAQFHIGWLYANGDGLKVDVPLAIEWWSQAAKRGYVDAEFAIGMAYLNGYGTALKVDLSEATKWLLASSRHGSEDAQEILLRLVRTDMDKVMANVPEILAEPWLGQRVRIISKEEAPVRAKPSPRAEVLEKVAPGIELRQIDQKNGWRKVVLSDSRTLGWIAAKEAQFVDSEPP